MKRMVVTLLLMMLCLMTVTAVVEAADEQPAPPFDLYGDLTPPPEILSKSLTGVCSGLTIKCIFTCSNR